MNIELKEFLKNFVFSSIIVTIGVMVVYQLFSVGYELYTNWNAYYTLASPLLYYIHDHWKVFALIAPVTISWNAILSLRTPEIHHISKIIGLTFGIVNALFVGLCIFSYMVVDVYISESDDFAYPSFLVVFMTFFIVFQFSRIIYQELRLVKQK